MDIKGSMFTTAFKVFSMGATSLGGATQPRLPLEATGVLFME